MNEPSTQSDTAGPHEQERSWWREPLVHFLVLGGALFALLRWQNPPNAETDLAPREIVITVGRIENVAGSFSRVWQRPPARAELDGLIEDYIREEVLYREALAIGLDRDDTIIRRRVRQKMEFISEDVAGSWTAAIGLLLLGWQLRPSG